MSLIHHGLLVDPCLELANMDVGQVFRCDGELYLLIAHHADKTEIARIYWFDFVIAKIVRTIMDVLDKFRQKKEFDLERT